MLVLDINVNLTFSGLRTLSYNGHILSITFGSSKNEIVLSNIFFIELPCFNCYSLDDIKCCVSVLNIVLFSILPFKFKLNSFNNLTISSYQAILP